MTIFRQLELFGEPLSIAVVTADQPETTGSADGCCKLAAGGKGHRCQDNRMIDPEEFSEPVRNHELIAGDPAFIAPLACPARAEALPLCAP